MIRSRSLLALLASAALASACRGEGEGPFVQDSAPGNPRTSVSINRVVAGAYRAISPSCVGQRYRITPPSSTGPGAVERTSGVPLEPGDVVEFRNYLPDVPTNVTALDAPVPMFSPSLVKPYNYVEGEEPYSFWRFRFPEPGQYEFFDTNMGEPGRKIVDSYYGTVSYVGESNAPRGMACVDAPGCVASLECLNGQAPEGTLCCSCPGVCCGNDQECPSGRSCLRGRCVDPSLEP